MGATGIIRRIDDSGRVVIPKEIRRTLHLQEGTPLEIFTGRKGEIILKKHFPIVELTALSGRYAETMVQSTGVIVCITDRDRVIVVFGGFKKDMIQKTISKQLEHVVGERNVVTASKDDKVFIPPTSDEMESITVQVIVPIICEGDTIGSVALFSRDAKTKFRDMEMKLILIVATFLGHQMEA